ncbi:MAG: copper amine oxidase N-terminal domain-containing protein [Armatimonadetes bacterium]|nr:copper amine oxidase N-terminal domain-containing protein [Armatimonadota bacterium]
MPPIVRVLCMLLLCHGASCASTQMGLLGLLRDVHAYSDGYTTYVPLLDTAEWAGASVDVSRPDVHVTLEGMRLRLTVGSGVCFTDGGKPVAMFQPFREIGGLLCVPARFWEHLGLAVYYVTPQAYDDPANLAERMDGNPVVVLSRHDRWAAMLVHSAPPDVVAKFIRDFENSDAGIMHGEDRQSCWLGRYGVDWIARVNDITQDHFRGAVPATLTEGIIGDGILSFWSGAAAVYGIRAGRWRILLATQWGYTRKDWLAAGIPLSVAQAWHETLH